VCRDWLGSAVPWRIDNDALYDDLIKGFICREYADFYGAMEYDFEKKTDRRGFIASVSGGLL